MTLVRLCAALILAAPLPAPDDEADLRTVVQSFFTAAARKDARAAMGVWSPQSPKLELLRRYVQEARTPIRAPATVVSQWQVADTSTSELMASFHRGISPGLPFAEALRQAQLKLLRNPRTSHPYYWAPFILVGAGRG